MRESGGVFFPGDSWEDSNRFKWMVLEKLRILADEKTISPGKKEEVEKQLQGIIESAQENDINLLLKVFHPYLLGDTLLNETLRAYTIFHLLLLYHTRTSEQIEVVISLLGWILNRADALLVSEALLDIPYYPDAEKTRLVKLAREKGYDLAVMSNEIKPGTIHIEGQEGGLFYRVTGPDEKIKERTIPWQSLPSNFERDEKILVSSFEQKETWLPHILEQTLEAQHTEARCINPLAYKFVDISPIELVNFRPGAIERVKELLAASKYSHQMQSFDLAVQLAKTPTEIKPAEIKNSLASYEKFVPKTTTTLTLAQERFWLDRLNKLLRTASTTDDPEKEANLNQLHAWLGRIYWLRYNRNPAKHSGSDFREYTKHFQAISLNKLDHLSSSDLLLIQEYYKAQKPRTTGKNEEENAQIKSQTLQSTYKQLIVLRAGIAKDDVEGKTAKERAKFLADTILDPEKKYGVSKLPNELISELVIEKGTKEEKKEAPSELSLDGGENNQEGSESKDQIDLQQALFRVAQASFDAGLNHYKHYLSRREQETRTTLCQPLIGLLTS